VPARFVARRFPGLGTAPKVHSNATRNRTQEPHMFNRIAPQATALGLAAVITAAMLFGMDRLALQEHAGADMYASDVPVQVVVITAQRLPRS